MGNPVGPEGGLGRFQPFKVRIYSEFRKFRSEIFKPAPRRYKRNKPAFPDLQIFLNFHG